MYGLYGAEKLLIARERFEREWGRWEWLSSFVGPSTSTSKSISYQVKMKDYRAVVRPACLYAVETLAKVEDPLVQKREGKFLQKM